MAAKAEKPDATAAPADKAGAGAAPIVEKKEAEASAGAPALLASKSSFNLKAWIPAIIAVLLAPAASWAVAQYAVLPMLRKKLAEPMPVAEAAAAAAAPDAKGGKAPVAGAPATYEFTNVVVNLAGTMGTRYLKTTFIVMGADASLKPVFEENKARLTDVTLNVLSSLTLADLEEPGSKNVLREKLVTVYNQALGRKVASQVYFSDFVVQ